VLLMEDANTANALFEDNLEQTTNEPVTNRNSSFILFTSPLQHKKLEKNLHYTLLF